MESSSVDIIDSMKEMNSIRLSKKLKKIKINTNNHMHTPCAYIV